MAYLAAVLAQQAAIQLRLGNPQAALEASIRSLEQVELAFNGNEQQSTFPEFVNAAAAYAIRPSGEKRARYEQLKDKAVRMGIYPDYLIALVEDSV